MNGKLLKQLEDSRYLRVPMAEYEEDGGLARWQAKEVLASRKLPLAEDFGALRHEGVGTMGVSAERTHSGGGSVVLDTPMRLERRIVPGNRAYAACAVTRPLDNEDIREYNRFSVWVYLEAESTPTVFIRCMLHNAGEHIIPVPGRFEGIHHDNASPGRWRHIVWEIPDLYRDCVTGFTVSIAVNGVQPEGDERVRLYVDDMRLEKVKAENSRGFALRENAIAYCHSGYLPDARKQALVQNMEAETFVLRDERGTQKFSGKVEALQDGFGLLDFSDLTEAGEYTIQVGDLLSKPFAIGPEAYLSAAWRTLNFFYTERCGFDVPGVHTICHQDLICRNHDGRTVTVCGGWHDAGDLSQIMDCTCDSILALLELASAVKDAQPQLYERLIEEARWGLNWVMRTRFGDGYRHSRLIFGLWSKNYVGDHDGYEVESDDKPFDNFMGASACAAAYPFYKDDPAFAAWCLRCAKEDFGFALDRLDQPREKSPTMESEVCARGSIAASLLHRITGESVYLDHAAYLARRVRACQQLTVMDGWTMPLRGFFYEDASRHKPVSYFHKSVEHTLTECFTQLLDLAPKHADAPLWLDSIEASADYLRGIADVMPPYGIMPAGIYKVNAGNYDNHPRDGANRGLPTMEEYNAQVKNGIRLDDMHYLRRFPVAFQFRGFHAPTMGKAKACFLVARALKDRRLYDIAVRQMEYVVGFNPFAMSTVYGEGYDYPPLYSEFAQYIVGSVPVGIETFENDDEPYMPMQNHCTYKEIWVHTTARLMWLIAEAYSGPWDAANQEG